MDFIKKLSDEEIKKANVKNYKVLISDTAGNCLILELSRVEFDSINVFLFVELGFSVIIQKLSSYV